MPDARRRLILLVLALVLPGVGCGGGYHLRGRVVEGEASYIAIVDPDDPRLGGRGLSGAELHLQLDPGRLQRETLARTFAGGDGGFDLTIDKFGAGVLNYDVGLFVSRNGYTSAELPFRLPSQSRRLLVVLAPGAGGPATWEDDDLWGEAERFRR